MRCFIRVISFCLLSAVLVTPCVAADSTTVTLQDARALFAQGNAAYQSQQYDVAEDHYKQLVRAGYDIAPVLYNLGTAAARQEKLGEALGYLIRAHELSPRDENIAANLDRVRQLHVQKYPPPKQPGAPATAVAESDVPAEAIWNQVTGILTAGEWLLIIWVAVMLATVGALLILLSRAARMKAAGRALLSVGLIAVVIIAIPASFRIYRSWLIQRAIAINNGDVLSGPADRFTRVAALQEGQIVRDLGTQTGGYHRVRLPNGTQGYVKNDILMQL